jgi:hypothetical protein
MQLKGLRIRIRKKEIQEAVDVQNGALEGLQTSGRTCASLVEQEPDSHKVKTWDRIRIQVKSGSL